MIYNRETAIRISEHLLQIKAIKLSVKKPFTWASGIKSPIYCDNRITLSYPRVRTFIRQEFVKIIQEEFNSIDVIAGVATGGIAQGALVAQDLDIPFVYIRTAQKSHGMENQIEGIVNPGNNVLVIEDLVSTGKSSLNAVKALKDADCNVKGMLAIFSYKLDIAEENFKKDKCLLYTLSDYPTLIKAAAESNYIQDTEIDTLRKWQKDPQNWKK
ncbi:MAG: orotate phosphoribosyltransferase [Bacteroidota bacterium]|nr:orotate phosphoribosyltransferase [Bacteroidota bacterium]